MSSTAQPINDSQKDFVLRPVSGWSTSPGKRIFDLVCAAVLLLPALPVMAIVAVLVKATSRGPVLFRQQRMGRDFQPFAVCKFRTMVHGPQQVGPGVTRGGDTRITPLGRILRKTKLDELPQLFNVLAGDMSMVGPRPDLAEYFDFTNVEHRALMMLRPGVTGAASLTFPNEEQVLQCVPPHQLLDHYLNVLMPYKMHIDLDYASRASLTTDVLLMLKTVAAVAR